VLQDALEYLVRLAPQWYGLDTLDFGVFFKMHAMHTYGELQDLIKRSQAQAK
jgi:hypothetical protein